MTKRLIAFVIVLAMLVSVLPVGVYAEQEGEQPHEAHSCAQCQTAGVTTAPEWTAWGNDVAEQTTLPTTPGHYYLTQNIQVASTAEISSGDVVLCLNGKQVTANGVTRFYILRGTSAQRAELSILDCTAKTDASGAYTAGSISGAADGAVCLGTASTDTSYATFNLYDGIFTGNGRTNANSGVVWMRAKGDSIFNMYGGLLRGNSGSNGSAVFAGESNQINLLGGEISGNTCSQNGAVYAQTSVKLLIDDCKITGNTSTTNGKAGGVYVLSAGTSITVTGKAVIDGNDNKNHSAHRNLYIDNNAAAQKLFVNELEEGAKISFYTKKGDSAAAENIIALATGGTQTAPWNCHWITYDVTDTNAKANSISQSNGAFVFGHIHADGVTYTPYDGGTSQNALPTGSNNYYLTNDIVRNASGNNNPLGISGTQKMCLNGYTITHQNPTIRLYTVTGSLTLEDGWAYTDEDGNYHSGGITYNGSGTGVGSTEEFGSAINVGRGGILTLKDGQIYGFNSTVAASKCGSPIYVAGANTTEGKKAVFNMTGGAIHHNTTKSGGGAVNIPVAGSNPDKVNTSEFNMSGGAIYSNEAGGNGGAILAESAKVNITGGEIYDNETTAEAGLGGAIYAKESNVNVENAEVYLNVSNGTGNAESGAMYLLGSSTTIKNAQITENTGKNTSGITAYGGSLTLDGAVIERNNATSGMGAVNVNNSATFGAVTFTVKGATRIVNNTVNESGAQNLYMRNSNSFVTVDGLSGNAKIGVTFENSRLLTDRRHFSAALNSANPAAYFESDVTGYSVIIDDDKLYYSNGHDHCDANDEQCDHTLQGWAAWTPTAEKPLPTAAGRYYLTESVELDKAWAVSADIKLCLNGKTISMQEGVDARLININAGGVLTISDCQSTGTLTGGTGGSAKLGGAIWIAREATKDSNGAQKPAGVLNLYGGTITKNTANEGGAVYVQSGKIEKENLAEADYYQRDGAVFNMYGGIITENTAKSQGGGVYVYGEPDEANRGDVPAAFNMYGGAISGNESQAYGGGIFAMGGAAVNISGGTVSDNKAAKNGGGIYAEDKVAVTLTNAVISGNESEAYGGGVYAKTGSALTITDSKLENNKSAKDGAGLYGSGVTAVITGTTVSGNESKTSAGGLGFGTASQVTLTDVTISGNQSPNGGGVLIQSGSKLELVSGKVEKNISTGHGGGIYVTGENSTLTVSGGTITENTAAKNGGGIYVANKGTVNISGGTIAKNSGVYGGGICVTGENAILTVSGGALSENTASENGGGIYVANKGTVNISGGTIEKNTGVYGGGIQTGADGTVSISGGTITGNTADHGGGIYANANAKQIAVSGKTVIKENQNGNLRLGGSVLLKVGALDKDAVIGISITSNPRAYSEKTDDFSANFISDSAYRKVVYKDGALYLEDTVVHAHCVCNNTTSGCDHSKQQWTAWESTTSLPTESGNYFLVADVQMAAPASVAKGAKVNLCLNGHTVKAAEGKRIYTVSANAVLSITDCTINPGSLTGGNYTYGGAFNVNRSATLNLWGGKICGNQSVDTKTGLGGAIYIQEAQEGICGGIFNMYGGEISGNTAAVGGAVYAAASALEKADHTQINIYGGKFSGNTSNGSAGAVYAGKYSVLNIAGGEFSSNTAATYGGAVYANTVNVTVSGGSFTENTSGKDGAVLYGVASTVKVSNGTMTANKTTGGAGGALGFSTGSQVTISGGSFKNNKAPHGGAIIIQGGADVTVTGGTFEGNEATKTGGAVYVSMPGSTTGDISSLTIAGGTFTGNKSATTGGTVYAAKGAQITMTDGLVTKSSNGTYGGTFYMTGTTAKFTGGKITENTSAKDGGGIYAVSESTVEIGGDIEVSNNTVTSGAGGGMGFASKTKVTISGGTFSGNWAVQGGAMIIQSGAQAVVSGGTFSGNESKAYAGAIYVNQPNKDGTLSTLTLSGGTITGNKSGNAAGGIYVNKGYLEMTGGEISKNTTANYGCGIYLMRAEGKITGGTITGNVSGKDGAGIYAYAGTVEIGGDVKVTNNVSEKGAGGGLGFTKECKAKLTGGTITGNDAGNAGGIIVQGQAHLTMTGGYVAYNTTRASGGGIYVNKSSADFYGGTITGNTSVKTGAGLFANDSTTRFAGTTFSKNEATANGGAMYINKGTATFNGGKYIDNTSQRYGGGIYINAATVDMQAATVSGNFAKVGSGGIHAYGGTLTIGKDVLLSENTTDSAGGGICVTKFCVLTMNGCIVEKNEANNGGGVLIQNWAEATLNDVIIRDNVSSDGTGLYVFSNVVVTVNGGEVTGNQSVYKLNKAGDKVGGNAAGVYVHTSVRTQTGQSTLYLNGTKISDNTAEANGGGVYVDMQMICHINGCTIENNTSGGIGGGIFQNSGTQLSVTDTTITGNSSAETGSGLYAGSDLTMDSVAITGNKTKNGSAVYLAPARYDGHSYANAVIKFAGDMQICDNEGTMPDLYIDEGVAIATAAKGFGKNTNIYLQLHSGILTNTILGAYNYEGGDCVYTLTYGDRSLTEPEYLAPAEETVDPTEGTEGTEGTQTTEPANEDTLLYAGVGAFAVVIAAVAVVVVLINRKKKKAEETAQEVSQD